MNVIQRLLIVTILCVSVVSGYAQDDNKKLTKEEKKAEKALQKKQKKEKEAAEWVLLQSFAENSMFVVEFDKFIDSRTGKQYVISSRINFLALAGDHVVIQLQTHQYYADNGLGGRTIDGTINNYVYTPPKNEKSPIVISFSVSSEHSFRGTNVRITVTEGGATTISLDSLPPFYGRFLSPNDANINIGVKMWN